jgi:hypothetical protein
MLTGILFPSLSPKEMHMTKTAGTMVVSLFALGLCVAPFAIAAPAQQTR